VRVLATLAISALVVFILVVLFVYVLLPGIIESRLAASLRESYGLEEEPTVEVSSNFPPELLFGRMDGIEVRMDSFVQEGIRLRDVRVDLRGVDVPVRSLLSGGDLERETRAVSLVASVPEEEINAYLRKNDLGLQGGKVDVRPRSVVYRSPDALFGLPASVGLDLRISGPSEIEVVPREAMVAGFPLPAFLTHSLASGGRTLDLGELPLGTNLQSVEPSVGDALAVRAEKR
jgi:hypothetical protein